MPPLAPTFHHWAEDVLRGTTVVGSLWLGVALATFQRDIPQLPSPAAALVEGSVAEAVEWQPSAFARGGGTQMFASFLCDVTSAAFNGGDATALSERVRCTLMSTTPHPIERGDMLSFSGRWERLAAATNPGQFDAASYFQCFDIYYRVTAQSGEIRWRTPSHLAPMTRLQRALDHVRQRAARTLAAPASLQPEGVILRNMILGARESLPDDIIEAFLRTGTFHIVAISGMHIGVVFGLWWGVVWIVGVPGRWRGATVVPLIWLYGIMAGMNGSVLRSVLMFSVLALAPLIARPHRAANSLLSVAWLYVVFWPTEVFSLGIQLTFICVATLIVTAPMTEAMLARLKWMRDPAVYDLEHPAHRLIHPIVRYLTHVAAGTLVIWLATWPVTMTRGNLVSPASWLANLLIVPLASIVLAAGFVTPLLAVVSSWLAGVLNAANLLLMHVLVWLMNVVSALPGGYFAVRSLTAGQLFWYYCTLALGAAWAWMRFCAPKQRPLRNRACGAATVAAVLVFVSLCPLHRAPDGGWRIAMLDVGLGDAIVIHAPGGRTVLIDGGVRTGPWSCGTRIVVPYLRSAGVNRLDAVVCTHFDRDHAGGLVAILQTMRVGTVYAPPDIDGVPLAAELRAVAAERGIEWKEAHAGDRIVIGALTGTVLHPPAVATTTHAAAQRGGNMWCLVIRFECNGRSFLATGDAPRAGEALQIARGARVASDVLKLAHHGSVGSSGDEYLDAVSPTLALLSVGPNNAHLPSPGVIDRLARRRLPVVRTDRMGACVVELKDTAALVSCFNNE